jgi:polyisoprenyl-phosphate glycosyltransferase
MKFSIIIPCYNEEKNIPLIIEKFSEVINSDDIEVIIVNNGSTDNSTDVIAKHIASQKLFKLVTIVKNQGYGFGILSGLNAASGEFIGWTHADMQTDPADVIKAFKLIEQNNSADNLYIKGTRKGRGLFDNFFTIGMSLFESIYMQRSLWEINAQPNIFHKSFFKQWSDAPHDFALDLYAYYKAKKLHLNIIRFPVKFPPRIHGSSKWNNSLSDKIKFIKRTISFSKALKHNLKSD